MEKIIEITGLKKSYGPVEAVKGIDFYVEKGSLFAFLGPNGAGKSTTINMINTVLKPDGGGAVIGGHVLDREDSKIRSILGNVFQEGVLDNRLTVKENLMIRGSLYIKDKKVLIKAVNEAAKKSGVLPYFKRPYGELSGGQKRRVDIAKALVNTPQILILDEPTTGLDPQTRLNIWETLERLRKEMGITIFLTTHYMEEAGRADYVVVIDKGLIIAKGTPADLKEQYSSDQLAAHTHSVEKVTAIVSGMGYAFSIKGDIVTIALDSTLKAIPVIEAIKDMISGFQVIEGSMDDAFINITGQEMRE